MFDMKGKRNIPCQTESKRKESGNYTVSSVNHKQADIPDLNIYAPSSRGESIFKIYKMMITLKRTNTSSVTGRQSQNKKKISKYTEDRNSTIKACDLIQSCSH